MQENTGVEQLVLYLGSCRCRWMISPHFPRHTVAALRTVGTTSRTPLLNVFKYSWKRSGHTQRAAKRRTRAQNPPAISGTNNVVDGQTMHFLHHHPLQNHKNITSKQPPKPSIRAPSSPSMCRVYVYLLRAHPPKPPNLFTSFAFYEGWLS